ncbi:MAG: AMP-binding protein [Mycoplasmoidaceae bacterium]|nr:AMP-binding protein [Mycoplasmoidaceae bacterium]
MAGYKVVLLNERFPSFLNNKIIKLLNVNYVVTQQELSKDIEANKIIINGCNLIPEICSLNKMSNEYWADEIALCTTATTLNCKICVYSGRNILEQLKNAGNIIKKCPQIKKHYKHKLKLLAFLPFCHIFGLVATFLWFSVFGRTIVFLPNLSSNSIVETVQKFEVTHIFSIPLF